MEEIDFQGLLDRFGDDGFQKGEQIVLGNFGTNQTLLTLIFQKPANVQHVRCNEVDDRIIRDVDLVVGFEIVGHATTIIPRARNSDKVWEAVKAGKLGLGQIIVTFSLPSKRVLMDVGHNEEAFWRTYSIEGPDLYFEISEHYPRKPFEAIGWLRKYGSTKTGPGSLMSVTDDEGAVYNFTKFVAIGVQEDGGVFLGIEDELMTQQEAINVVIQGSQVIGELANGITTVPNKEKEE